MLTTGITRRIDELGRVVIPKEIRRTMRLREGEEMEIFVEDNSLVLKKYSSLATLVRFADEVAESLSVAAGGTVVITDNDKVVAAAGENKKDYIDRQILNRVTKTFCERITRTFLKEDGIALTGDDVNIFRAQIFAPVVVGGDVTGGVILLLTSEEGLSSKIKLIELSANILSNIIQ
ncbi:MAG: AbrB/MazE/SpoVT family DNA-binding domain-containing protein [Christensenellaceae bacterium]|nr:AbrB/MazE/SpoVT family DNA-binding domain-containing protein [Christensenellaceae bacterium]